ncbi:hypothetical protein FQN57_000358 [Myotisia sp. PD_48]|nr:hypothetical protein FQN57_000358 [Myotisia sp. PD_48]
MASRPPPLVLTGGAEVTVDAINFRHSHSSQRRRNYIRSEAYTSQNVCFHALRRFLERNSLLQDSFGRVVIARGHFARGPGLTMNTGLPAVGRLCRPQLTLIGALISLQKRAYPRRQPIQPAVQAFAGVRPFNSWQKAGDAAFDFRIDNTAGDVVTKPTASMLDAIANTSLLDDNFQEDPTTNALQEFMAKLTNHEDSLLVMSGTMGNQVAIRTHLTQPPYAVLCDHRAHIIHSEGGGVTTWTGAYLNGIVPRNGKYLMLEDIQNHAVLDDDFHGCPTRVISLENTLDGTIMPLSETQRICEWAHRNDLRVHLDGARLWEAVVAGAGSLTDFTSCADSVSLCFSKGLGSPIGSILVGSEEFIRKARWFRKSIGGGTRQAGVIAAAARVAVEETFGSGPNGEGGKLLNSHKLARRIAASWTEKGGIVKIPVETNMVWIDLDAAGISFVDWEEIGRQEGLKLMGDRLVLHYQISEEAMTRLERVMDRAFKGEYGGCSTPSTPGRYYGQI